MDKLHDINRAAIHKKLDAIHRVEVEDVVYYYCKDVIDVLSRSKATDMRGINDYGDDEILLLSVKVGGKLRSRRYFSMAGLTKYVQNTPIISYKHVCEYFGISVIDKEKVEYGLQLKKIEVAPGLYDTRLLLKWLTGTLYKPHSKLSRDLPSSIGLLDILEYIDDFVDAKKLSYINEVG